MALVRCSECGAKVSQYAEECPSCGFPCEPMSDAQYAEQLNLVKAARRHDLKWWGVAAGLFVLYLIIFGPLNIERAKEKEAAEMRVWEQEQRQKEQDQRTHDAWRAFNR